MSGKNPKTHSRLKRHPEKKKVFLGSFVTVNDESDGTCGRDLGTRRMGNLKKEKRPRTSSRTTGRKYEMGQEVDRGVGDSGVVEGRSRTEEGRL